MINTRSNGFRLSMFGLIYFVQGSALAYFRNFQKPYLDSLSMRNGDRPVAITVNLL